MKKIIILATLLSPVVTMAAWVEPQAVPVVLASPAKSKPLVKAAVVSETLPIYYGAGLCTSASAQYECVKVDKSQSWESLFPDEVQRDLIQRVNRNYNYLWQGKVIAVPRDLAHVQLVNWGPIASGRDKCPDSPRACKTLTGIYRVFSKESDKCKSDVFPIGKGGAPMPYCMYFHKGFALHGSADMPGYRASHGCVRMFTRDAKWLNENFVESSNPQNNDMGTKVVVRPVVSTGISL